MKLLLETYIIATVRRKSVLRNNIELIRDINSKMHSFNALSLSEITKKIL